MATNERAEMIFLAIAESGYAFTIKSEGSSLATFQKIVDGNVDVVTTRHAGLPHTFDLWVNDEGLYRNDFITNLVASHLTGTVLVGPAVMSNVNINTGETTGLTSTDLKSLSSIMEIDTNFGNHYTVDEAAYWMKAVA